MIEEIQKKILVGKLTEWITKLISNESDRAALMTKISEIVKKVRIEKISFGDGALEMKVSWDASKPQATK